MTSPHRLVVIGNGMAGARLVEDVLARASGDRFRITMFGDEPYGNYNRILLSGVLAGTQQPDDIFINPLDWYADNDVTLHAGIGAARIDREAKVVYGARRPGRALRHAGHRHRLGAVRAAVREPGADRARARPRPVQGRRLRLPHPRGLRAHAGPRRRREVGRGDRRRPARPRSGARPVGPRPRGQRGASDGTPDGDAARSRRRADAAEVDGAARGQGAPRQVDDRPPRQRRRHRPAVQGRLEPRVRPAGHRRRHPPERGAGEVGRPRDQARHRRRRRHGDLRPVHLRGRRVRRAPRHGLRPGGAAVGADGGAGRSADRARRGQGLRRLAHVDEAQGDGRRPRRHGREAEPRRRRRGRHLRRAAAAASTTS